MTICPFCSQSEHSTTLVTAASFHLLGMQPGSSTMSLLNRQVAIVGCARFQYSKGFQAQLYSVHTDLYATLENAWF